MLGCDRHSWGDWTMTFLAHLPLGPIAFAEIKAKLALAGYEQAIMHDGKLSLSGIAVCPLDDVGRAWEDQIGYHRVNPKPTDEEVWTLAARFLSRKGRFASEDAVRLLGMFMIEFRDGVES